MPVYVRAHIRDTARRPSRVNPAVCTERPSVGRQQSSCSQRTFLVSLIRRSAFAKFSKFRDFGAKTTDVTFSVCCLRVEYFTVFCVASYQSVDSSEWNPPVQIEKSCGGCEKRKRRKDKESEKRWREIQEWPTDPDYQLNLIEWLIPQQEERRSNSTVKPIEISSTSQSKSNDNQFELRTTTKKEKRRSYCAFLGHFPDQFRSSCLFRVPPVFLPVSRSSPNWFVGLSTDRINISVSDVISCWNFCHRVSGRPSHRSWSPWFRFCLPKTLEIVTNYGTKSTGTRIKGESPDYFVTSFSLSSTILSRERVDSVHVSWFSNKNSEWKRKERKWAQQCDGLYNDRFGQLGCVLFCPLVVLAWKTSALFGSVQFFVISRDASEVANLCIRQLKDF